MAAAGASAERGCDDQGARVKQAGEKYATFLTIACQESVMAGEGDRMLDTQSVRALYQPCRVSGPKGTLRLFAGLKT